MLPTEPRAPQAHAVRRGARLPHLPSQSAAAGARILRATPRSVSALSLSAADASPCRIASLRFSRIS
eukprot:13665070-Alexandrium_andersonii.AAC.1